MHIQGSPRKISCQQVLCPIRNLIVYIDFVVIDICAPVSVHEVSPWRCISSLITFSVVWNGLRADAAFALDVSKQVTPPTNGRQKLGWVSRTWFTLGMLLKWNATYECKIPLVLVASCVFSRAVPLSRKMLVVTISKVFVCCSEWSPLRICAFPSCRSKGHQRLLEMLQRLQEIITSDTPKIIRNVLKIFEYHLNTV